MGKIVLALGIILLALIFEKSPTWGMFVIAVYFLIKFKQRKFNSNRGLIDSNEKNTYVTIKAINEGFEKIADAISRRDEEDDYYEDEKGTGINRKRSTEISIFRN